MAAKRSPRPNRSDGDNPENASFESKLSELEEVVRLLEEGEKPLEESLALYERGVAALKSCHRILDQTEKRIRMLVRGPGGRAELRDAPDFAPEEEDAGAPPAGRRASRGSENEAKPENDEGLFR